MINRDHTLYEHNTRKLRGIHIDQKLID